METHICTPNIGEVEANSCTLYTRKVEAHIYNSNTGDVEAHTCNPNTGEMGAHICNSNMGEEYDSHIVMMFKENKPGTKLWQSDIYTIKPFNCCSI